MNRVQRSLVRVDADETSYGLHVILRFELEQALVSTAGGEGPPGGVNTRFEELLGLEVPNDRLGVLQDSHWSTGAFGYFRRTSALSCRCRSRRRRAKRSPSFDEQFEREFSELHAWLRENLYALGSRFTPADTIERVVGGPVDFSVALLRYLAGKLDALAKVAATPLARSASRPGPVRVASTSRPRGGAVVVELGEQRPRRRGDLLRSRGRWRTRSPSTALVIRSPCARTGARRPDPSSVAGGSKLWSVLMFRHMTPA